MQNNKLFEIIFSKGQGSSFFFFLFSLMSLSLIETSQSIGGRNGRAPGKPPDTPASRTWLVSHVASAGLEPTPYSDLTHSATGAASQGSSLKSTILYLSLSFRLHRIYTYAGYLLCIHHIEYNIP